MFVFKNILHIIIWYCVLTSSAGDRGGKFDAASFILFCSIAVLCSLFGKIARSWKQSNLLTISFAIAVDAANKIATQGLVGPLSGFVDRKEAAVKVVSALVDARNGT